MGSCESTANPHAPAQRTLPPTVERKALVHYRAILGGQGSERRREDGRITRRGLPEKIRQRLTTPKERQFTSEIPTHRGHYLTNGVIPGSRSFIGIWFTANRDRLFTGRSGTHRQHGANSHGRPALRGLYTLRNPSGTS